MKMQRPASCVFYKDWKRDEEEEQLLVNTRLICCQECGSLGCPLIGSLTQARRTQSWRNSSRTVVPGPPEVNLHICTKLWQVRWNDAQPGHLLFTISLKLRSREGRLVLVSSSEVDKIAQPKDTTWKTRACIQIWHRRTFCSAT